jgi:hypothetical protein
VTAVHATHLPPSWLGKTHALALGAADATSEWLLFTDADVRFYPRHYRWSSAMPRNGCDNVACLPITGGSWWPKRVEALFMLTFVLWVRPHQVANPHHPASVGVGPIISCAQDLSCDREPSAVAVRPDDIKLGQVLKRHGFRQRPVDGTGLLAVTWYPSIREMVRGLGKTIFAACDYRMGQFLLVVLSLLGLFAGSLAGDLLAHGGPEGSLARPSRSACSAARHGEGGSHAGYHALDALSLDGWGR